MTRTRLLFLLVSMLATEISTSTSNAPIRVGVPGLFKYSEKYQGKTVEVFGYWVTSCAHCSDLYPSFEEEQRKPYGTYISLGDLRQARMPQSLRAMLEKSWGNYDGYVRVVGTFRYTPIPDWVGKRPPVKQIMEITKLEPIGPAIPSKIQDNEWRQMGMTPPSPDPTQSPPR